MTRSANTASLRNPVYNKIWLVSNFSGVFRVLIPSRRRPSQAGRTKPNPLSYQVLWLDNPQWRSVSYIIVAYNEREIAGLRRLWATASGQQRLGTKPHEFAQRPQDRCFAKRGADYADYAVALVRDCR
jgi:hypothetical protein